MKILAVNFDDCYVKNTKGYQEENDELKAQFFISSKEDLHYHLRLLTALRYRGASRTKNIWNYCIYDHNTYLPDDIFNLNARDQS